MLCATCKADLEPEAFSIDRHQRRGRDYECRLCSALVRPARRRGFAVPLPTTEKRLIEANTRLALALCEWNVSKAARLLGISRDTVHARINRLGLVRPAREEPPERHRPSSYAYGEVCDRSSF